MPFLVPPLARHGRPAGREGSRQHAAETTAPGVDVNTPGLRDGRTPYEEALRAGHGQIAEYRLRHGATKIELDRWIELAELLRRHGARASRELAQ